MKKRVLFICTNNSCRSQMAEGFANHELGDKIEAYSAGMAATSVNPRAIQSMAETGIDISGQRSKNMDEFTGKHFDYVITLCGGANEQCPLFFGGVKKIHIGFRDPAAVRGSEETTREAFRTVRDEIKSRLREFFANELAAGGNHDSLNQ